MSKLVIACSQFQSQVADLLPCNKGKKSQLVHGLMKSYSLFDKFDHIIIKPYCDEKDLLKFHTKSYVDTILNSKYDTLLPYDDSESCWSQLIEMGNEWSRTNDTTDWNTRAQLYECYRGFKSSNRFNDGIDGKETNITEFNLEGDCPIFSYLPMYCQVITGATLKLADYIELKPSVERTIAINWDGGRHHAMKQKASGFCYVNDIVLLIQKLRSKGFKKLSYIDFDLHHGDGVEKAFQFSSNVQTISIHLFECGFFPTTGSLRDSEKGRNVANIPLAHGLDDKYLDELVIQVIIPLVDRHSPEAIIIQCGGDGLMGDEYNEWQLSIRGLSENIMRIVNRYCNSSIVLLGGGGYNPTVMSRFYTYLTGKLIDPNFLSNEEDSTMIPEHAFIEAYQDEHYKFWAYEMEGSLLRKTLKNENETDFINKLKDYYRI